MEKENTTPDTDQDLLMACAQALRTRSPAVKAILVKREQKAAKAKEKPAQPSPPFGPRKAEPQEYDTGD